MKKRRLSSIVTALVMVLSLFALLPQEALKTDAADTAYELYICGKQVTSANCSDVLGNGKKEAVYDPSTNTLYLNGDLTMSESTDYAVNNEIRELTINVNKDLTVRNSGGGVAIRSGANTTITGNAILTVSGWAAGISVTNSFLTIKDTTVKVDADCGIMGGSGNDKLLIKNASVYAHGSNYAIGRFSNYITLNDCRLTEPLMGSIAKSSGMYHILDNKGQLAKDVRIIASDYALEVCGVQVEPYNKDDILGSGKKEAVYDPSTKTLELNGDLYSENEKCIYSAVKGLTIKVMNDVTLTNTLGITVFLEADTTITGPGKLTVKSPKGRAICATRSTLTIKNARVEVDGKYGIAGLDNDDKLVIRDSEVIAAGTSYAVGLFSHGIGLYGCYISSSDPTGSGIVPMDPDAYFIGSGSTYATKATVSPTRYMLEICGEPVTTLNASDFYGNGNKEIVYKASSNTLELSADIANTTNYPAILNEIKGLTVKVKKNISVTGTGADPVIKCTANTAFTGTGKLTVVSSGGVAVFADNNAVLSVMDANIDASGRYGIVGNMGYEYLTVSNSNIKAHGSEYAIGDFRNKYAADKAIDLGGCYITEPAVGKAYRLSNGYWYVFDVSAGSNRYAKDVTIVPPYDLTLGGVQITADNQDAILGDRSAEFDFAKKELHLDGVSVTAKYGLWNGNCDGLKLVVDSDSTLDSDDSSGAAIKTKVNMTITGEGTLTADGHGQQAGISVLNGKTLTVAEANVDCYGTTYAFLGASGAKLVINGSNVTADSGDTGKSSIAGFPGGVVLRNASYITPADAYVKTGAVYTGNDVPARNIKIISDPLVNYDLSVCNVYVTNFNCHDILGDGSAVYDPEENELWLFKDIEYSGSHPTIGSSIYGLRIRSNKNITVSNNTLNALSCRADTVITTGGKLTFSSPNYYAVTVSSYFTLRFKNADVEIKGKYGMDAYNNETYVVFENSEVLFEGTQYALRVWKKSSMEFYKCSMTDPTEYILSSGILCYKGTSGKYLTSVKIGTVLPGDVNKDGKINMRDYATLQKYLLDPTKVEISLAAADLSGDGKVNMRDYALLQKLLLKQK